MRVEAKGCRRRSRAAARSSHRQRGATLMELLVAMCVSAMALGAAWPWLWNAGEAARAVDGRAQAATSAAFAARSIVTDLELATALLVPPVGVAPEHCLHMRHRHPGEPAETILVTWDPARQVLWRKTSSAYLADHVESFSVTYFNRQGDPLGSSEQTHAEWPGTVARVRVAIRVSTPAGSSCAIRDVALGAR